MSANRLRLFRWLHGTWAVIGVAACVLLALAKGHPPGLVFVPFAAAVWLLGHGALWLANRLVDRSERVGREQGIPAGKWPPFLVLLAFCCGAVFFAGLLLTVRKLIFGGLDPMALALLLIVWLPPALCFVGILYRKYWAMFIASAGFFAMAGFLIFEVAYSVMSGFPPAPGEWMMAFVVVSFLVVLALYVLRSRAIKAFFGRT